MMKKISLKVKDVRLKSALATPEPAVSVLHTPVNMFRFSLQVLAIIAVAYALDWAQVVFIPLMLGLMISYALSAPVNLMQKWHIPRAIGAAVLLLSIMSVMSFGVYSLSDDASELIETLPEATHKFRLALLKERGKSQGMMEKMQKAATQLEQAANETGAPAPAAPKGVTRVQVEKPQLNIKDYLWMGTKGAIGFAGQLTIVPFLAYFTMISGNTFRRKIVRIAGPTLSKKKNTLRVLDEITTQIQRYLLVQIFTSIVVGVATWLAFLWIGLEHAAIWGIAAALFNTIPYLGPIIVTGGTALVSFLQFGTIGMAIFVACISLFIMSLEGYLLLPWLTAGRAE